MTVYVVPGYMINDQDVAGDPLYYGFTDNDGNWYILQQNVANNTFRYCRGLKNSTGFTAYATNWTGRAGLTYTTWIL